MEFIPHTIKYTRYNSWQRKMSTYCRMACRYQCDTKLSALLSAALVLLERSLRYSRNTVQFTVVNVWGWCGRPFCWSPAKKKTSDGPKTFRTYVLSHFLGAPGTYVHIYIFFNARPTKPAQAVLLQLTELKWHALDHRNHRLNTSHHIISHHITSYHIISHHIII